MNVHSKTPESNVTQKGSFLGGGGGLNSDSIPGQQWPENLSTCRGIWPELDQFDLYLSNLQNADQIRGHIDPGVFRV